LGKARQDIIYLHVTVKSKFLSKHIAHELKHSEPYQDNHLPQYQSTSPLPQY